MQGEPTYGAWDQREYKSPDGCDHNWHYAAYSHENVCVRCGTRIRFMQPKNVHHTALIGQPAQWRDHETKYPVEIHPTATVGAYTCIDAGCERATKVGANTQVMKQVHIGHGVQIGENCDIATGTVIAGEVTIGNNVKIGIGALIKPYLVIGDNARIGMGAVVISNVPDDQVWAGNPARCIAKKPEPSALDVLREAQGW